MPDRRRVLRSRQRPRGRAAQRKIRTLLPVSFRSHLKASIREALLAFESLFDEAVKALEKEGRRGPGRRGREIRVE
jgi:hypothetical protein